MFYNEQIWSLPSGMPMLSRRTRLPLGHVRLTSPGFFARLSVVHIGPDSPRFPIPKLVNGLKLSVSAPLEYISIVGIDRTETTRKSQANAFNVSRYNDAPRPISFRIGSISLFENVTRFPVGELIGQCSVFVFFT